MEKKLFGWAAWQLNVQPKVISSFIVAGHRSTGSQPHWLMSLQIRAIVGSPKASKKWIYRENILWHHPLVNRLVGTRITRWFLNEMKGCAFRIVISIISEMIKTKFICRATCYNSGTIQMDLLSRFIFHTVCFSKGAVREFNCRLFFCFNYVWKFLLPFQRHVTRGDDTSARSSRTERLRAAPTDRPWREWDVWGAQARNKLAVAMKTAEKKN